MWRPIETAPKDGSAFVALTNYGLPCTMYYDGEDFVRTVTCRRCGGMGLGSLNAWMPLPERYAAMTMGKHGRYVEREETTE